MVDVVFEQHAGVSDVFNGSNKNEGNKTLKEKRGEVRSDGVERKVSGCRFIRTYLVVMCCSYLFSRPLALVVAFDLDANHSRLVHDVLNVPTVLTNHFR